MLKRFIITALPIKVLLLVSMGLWLLQAESALAATLKVTPATGVYTAGQTFTARVQVNTTGASINAAEGTLKFDPNQLSVLNISKGSIFSLWTAEPSFSNGAGTISFSGGSPSGYTGSAGTILTVTFRSKGAGTAKVNFSNGSVLAADGRGTNVLTSMSGGAFTLAAADVAPEPEVIEYVAPANTPAAPQITSTSHPDNTGWYTSTTAQLAWNIPSDVVAVRTLLDENSGSIPTKVYEPAINTIELTDLDEGVQYFHLQFKNSDGWGRVAHYRLAVDTKNPTTFEITPAAGVDSSNPEQILQLAVNDETSAVDRYLVQLDGAEPYEYIDEAGSSTVTLPSLEPGYHTVIIEAFDQAGNSIVSTYSFTITAFDRPVFIEYPSQINSEVIPVISGQTKPGALVTVSLRNITADSVSVYEVTADQDGVFTLIPDGRLSNGVYELSATAVDSYGAQSEPSIPIRIAVQDPGYIQIGTLIVSVLSVVIPLVALVLLLVLAVLYFLTRIKRVRTFVVRETDEALAVLDSEFTKLQNSITSHTAALTKSRKTKKLTKAEAAMVEELQEKIHQAEKKIKKEIADVDDAV